MAVPCCNPTVTLDDGVPAGKIVKFGGKNNRPLIDAYVTYPPSFSKCADGEGSEGLALPSGAIVIATDVFGLDLINTKLVADEFARQTGFVVVAPDVFDGKPIPPNEFKYAPDEEVNEDMGFFEKIGEGLSHGVKMIKMVGWFAFNRPSSNLPKLVSVIEELRDPQGDWKMKAIGVQGYCYGGKLGAWLAGDTNKVDAASLSHPSLLSTDDIKALKKPVLFQCAEVDGFLPESLINQAKEILANKPDVYHRFTIYKGTVHGFAVRGSKKNQVIKQAREDAIHEASEFFKEHLNQVITASTSSTPSPSTTISTEST